MADSGLRHIDPQSWIDLIWDKLFSYRDELIPEGNPDYDDEWSDICTAMAWITEELNLSTGPDDDDD